MLPFKLLSKFNHGLLAVDAQLRELHAMATELANPSGEVVMALPAPVSKAKAEAKANAVDVEVKSEKTMKVIKANKAPKKKARKFNKPASNVPRKLTKNDSKLMQYLQGTLKSDDWTPIVGADMSKGAGMPLGSVGASLKKLIDNGAVKMRERGSYQLGV